MSARRQGAALTAAAEPALLDVPRPALPERSQRLLAARQREWAQRAPSAPVPALRPVLQQPAPLPDGGVSCCFPPEVRLLPWVPVPVSRQFRGGAEWLLAVRRRALSSRVPSGHGCEQPDRHSKD